MSLDISGSPYEIFADWFQEAQRNEPADPNAMALATASAAGMPSVRMVLLKGWSTQGFVFYTNLESRKGQELQDNPNAALCFHWKSLEKQIRIEGPVEPVDEGQADAYFNSRPRDSQIGAWASRQSRPYEQEDALALRFESYKDKFKEHETIPRPPFWSGYVVKPVRFEFWVNHVNRLHERIEFIQEQDKWSGNWIYP